MHFKEGTHALLRPAALRNSHPVPIAQGRSIDPNNELIIKNVRGSPCMQLAWHPLLPLLAIGWKDGELACKQQQAAAPSWTISWKSVPQAAAAAWQMVTRW